MIKTTARAGFRNYNILSSLKKSYIFIQNGASASIFIPALILKYPFDLSIIQPVFYFME